ncbi:MAG: 2-oxoglutarate oxidoreductase, partial [Desulfurococcales archaeon ex4484_42]
MRHDLLIAGRGGQGILVLGYVLGLALVKYEGMYVVEMESYS